MNETRKDEKHLQVVEALHELRLASIRGNLEGVKNTLHKGNFTEYTHGKIFCVIFINLKCMRPKLRV